MKTMKKVLKFSERMAIKDSLNNAIDKNVIALDKLENWINKVSDMYSYNEDECLVDDLDTLKYIKYCLEYLGTMYEESYKQYGGKL